MFDFYHYENIIIPLPFSTRAEMGCLNLRERAVFPGPMFTYILHDTVPENAGCTTVLATARVVF